MYDLMFLGAKKGNTNEVLSARMVDNSSFCKEVGFDKLS